MSALRYDAEYPIIGYSGTPVGNSIARLQARLLRGDVKLEFSPPRGYLDSVLKNLGIDPSSQTLVYSKSSLQVDWIKPATPRAIYFDDDTYVAWVQGSGLLEFVAMDSALGPVFYTLSNHKDATAGFVRDMLRCLDCHDKFSLQGGGVPMFLVTSSRVDADGLSLKPEATIEVTDQTPLPARWGGWYVTGQRGRPTQLGDVFDTRPYLTDKSDIVALLVLEHQATVYNLITRVNFKVRSMVARQSRGGAGGAGSWEELPPQVKVQLRGMMEPLVRAMLFAHAAPLMDKVAGTSGFDVWFQAQGPRDEAGRSLRDLDLRTRLFKHPLSYLVYSPAFAGLPDYVKSYVYGRFADILTGRDHGPAFSGLSRADRTAMLEILTATQPEFARAMSARRLAFSK